MIRSVSYLWVSDYEVFGERVLTGVSGWLQSRPISSVVSGHCFRFPKNNLHGCRTHEVLESLWPLWIEFPQAEGAAFAGQKTPNQHNLHHYDQIDLPLLEVSNPALQ